MSWPSIQTVNVTLSIPKSTWEFPKSRFVEWEEKDEEWCRPLGIGRETTRIDEVVLKNCAVTSMEFDPPDPERGALVTGTMKFTLVPDASEFKFQYGGQGLPVKTT